MQLEYFTLDVFTDKPFDGNPLAVIPHAPQLDDAVMQAIAREFNYPETVFVLPAEHPDALYRLRIFTPQRELPFAGHPTIGTAQLLAELDMAPHPTDDTSVFRLEEGIGLVPVSVKREQHGGYFTWLTTPGLPMQMTMSETHSALADMLGLSADRIGYPGMPEPRTYSAGVPFIFIPVADRQTLRECTLDLALWRVILKDTVAPQVYVFCAGEPGAGVDFHARMFAPGLGVPEDPATGAAAAAFAGYIWDATSRDGEYVIAQGEDMQRPGRLHMALQNQSGQLRRVCIGGSAVRVCHGFCSTSNIISIARRPS